MATAQIWSGQSSGQNERRDACTVRRESLLNRQTSSRLLAAVQHLLGDGRVCAGRDEWRWWQRQVPIHDELLHFRLAQLAPLSMLRASMRMGILHVCCLDVSRREV